MPHPKQPIDPVCLFHGKKASEHDCLYCSLCYKEIRYDQCNVLPDGERENVCVPCAEEEHERFLAGK